MNELLRDHVTSTGFALTLGRTHIFALVKLDLELAAEVSLDYATLRGTLGGLNRMDISALQGLERRGLVTHVFGQHEHKYTRKDGRGRDPNIEVPRRHVWNITPAGRLVIGLLKEAELYSEYAGPLLPLVEARRRRVRAGAA